MRELTEEEKKETERSSTGGKILGASILGLVLACAVPAGGGAAFIGMISLIAFVVGFFMRGANRSEEQIRSTERMMMLQAQSLALSVKAGDTAKTKKIVDDMSGVTAAKKKEENKKILKGAIVGGIVGGDVGAVVGATMAKNQIDEENKQHSN